MRYSHWENEKIFQTLKGYIRCGFDFPWCFKGFFLDIRISIPWPKRSCEPEFSLLSGCSWTSIDTTTWSTATYWTWDLYDLNVAFVYLSIQLHFFRSVLLSHRGVSNLSPASSEMLIIPHNYFILKEKRNLSVNHLQFFFMNEDYILFLISWKI